MNSLPVLFLGAMLGCAAACGADSAMTDADALASAPEHVGCKLPSDVSGSPHSVEDVIAIANALPPGSGVACFLQTLEHPVHVAATTSFLSLQPSAGERSPRIFIFSDPLFMSVVPDGAGQPRVELTVLQADLRSIKAEIVLPRSDPTPLHPGAAYEHILAPGGKGTVCSTCHGHEEPVPGVPDAFSSTALRPSPADRVALGSLMAEARRCDHALEAERCAMLDAIFDGPVVAYEFPSELALFGSSGG